MLAGRRDFMRLAAWPRCPSIPAAGLAPFLRGVSVQEPPAWTELACGAPTTRSVWAFDLEQDSRPTYVTQVRTFLLYRGDRIHTFHFMDGLSGEAAAGAELEAAVGSLSYGAS